MEHRHVRGDSVPAICRRGSTLGIEGGNRKREGVPFELAHVWTQAARASEHPMPAGINYNPTDHRATL
jgi:hypothetical protein